MLLNKVLSLILVFSFLPAAGALPSAEKEWLKIKVQKVDLLKNMFMPGVEHLFVKTNSEVFVPPIQHFRREIRSSFEADFKRITREILQKTAEGAKLPSYVKTVDEDLSVTTVQGKQFNTHYLEYRFKGETADYVGCFTAVQSGKYIHTFFTQAFASAFKDCKKEMASVVQQI